GTEEENGVFAAALGHVLSGVSSSRTYAWSPPATVRRPSVRQLAPLRLTSFRLLFLSTLGSSVGTLLAAIALAIDVKDRTNSGWWIGALMIVDFLPTIAIGLALGPLLDRLSRRGLMVAADLVRAGVFCAL